MSKTSPALNEHAVKLLDALGQSEVARRMGVSRQAVNKWRIHGIPPDRVADMKAAFPRAGWRTYRPAIGRGRSR